MVSAEARKINRPPVTWDWLVGILDRLALRYGSEADIPGSLLDKVLERANDAEAALRAEQESREQWLSLQGEWPDNLEGD